MKRTRIACLTFAFGAMGSLALTDSARAQSVADFYRGRNVTLVIGFSVGGGYDLYGRLLARHLGKHIPGQPSIVPQNREGAGSERAVLYLYNAAPKDGTVIGTFSRSMAVAPLLTNAPFDATKLSWLGSISSDVSVCMTWYTSPIKTFDDMLATSFTMGGLGKDADPDIFAMVLRNVFGAKLKLVSGYPGTNDGTLAMERGEVSGMCGISWSTARARHADWLKAKKVNMPVQFGLRKEAAIADVPAVMDLVKGEEQTRMVRLILAGQAMARPYAAPPGIPDDRRRGLIAAFDATMKDPEFLADAEKLQADVSPVSAGEIDKLLADVYATPKDIIAKAAKAIAN
ncbi:MAG TPA: tripartite tricarboxylate transporter substrate-binding protein [Xanthobacteraceae bacterium]|nr:tripartite tricarboxylate transporter substrate-binding protein [Xanthobacteraceae bacterium]